MSEIRSNASIASKHSRAIRSTARQMQDGLGEVTATQSNNPESSLISCFSSLRSTILAMSDAIANDAGNIQAIGAAINSMDDRISRELQP